MAETEADFFKNVEKIYKEYYGSLCYYAMNFVRETETAQDLVQDVFVRLIEARQTFQSADHCRNFLYLSVKNACLNHLEKESVRQEWLQSQPRAEEEAELPDEKALTAEVYRKLKQAVDELPRECRKIFYMSYFEDKSNEDIADRLAISVNTVRAQKARGKALLREKLKNLYLLIFLFPSLFQ